MVYVSAWLTLSFRADAIPKKRGPKTDVLEALVKRVNQMEKALGAEGKAVPPQDEPLVATDDTASNTHDNGKTGKAPILQKPPLSPDPTSGHVERHNRHDPPEQTQSGVAYGGQSLRYAV